MDLPPPRWLLAGVFLRLRYVSITRPIANTHATDVADACGFRRPAAPSPTSPPAQPPTTGLMLTREEGKAMSRPSRQARSEPVLKSAGLHLRRRLRLSYDRGPPQPSRS